MGEVSNFGSKPPPISEDTLKQEAFNRDIESYLSMEGRGT